MTDAEPRDIVLTDELIQRVTHMTFKFVPQYCDKTVDRDDVLQEVLTHLVRKPPRFDPARGASETTLLHLIVQRQVMKYAKRTKAADTRQQAIIDHQMEFLLANERVDAASNEPSLSDPEFNSMLRLIDCEETRLMCRLFLDSGGNVSEVARRMDLTEGAIRYRLRMLAPRLVAAGFKRPGL